MKKVRKSVLPPGWYPRDRAAVESQFREWGILPSPAGRGVAGIVPHAGWFFSGELMAGVLTGLDPELDVMVVAGGHMGDYDIPAAYFYRSLQTPLGDLPVAEDLLEFLRSRAELGEDTVPDNTVEVVLPMIRFLFPGIHVLGMRVPPDTQTAVHLAQIIKEASEEMNVAVGVIGSTDLTHYGSNYGFAPAESLKDPEGWVAARDRKVLDALVQLDIERAVGAAVADQSACSIGGAAVAAAYARDMGMSARELGYSTSLARHQSDSFVGYGGIVYERPE